MRDSGFWIDVYTWRGFCWRKISLNVLYCYSIEDLSAFSQSVLGQICLFYDHNVASIDKW